MYIMTDILSICMIGQYAECTIEKYDIRNSLFPALSFFHSRNLLELNNKRKSYTVYDSEQIILSVFIEYVHT